MTTVYTIGYEGTDIDRFAATLLACDVECLVDVRAIAISRKKGFSKSALSERCRVEGIEYRHLVELGDPKDGREAARAGRYADFRRIYGNHLTQQPSVLALDVVHQLASSRLTCLMCFERDPLTCHRSVIGESLQGRGIVMFHLFGDSPSRYIPNAAKLPGRHSRQGATAA